MSAPRAGRAGAGRLIADAREDADALILAANEEAAAGPHAETDPAVDRAWERVAHLRTVIGLHIRELEELAAARRDRADAGRGEHDAAAIADLLDYCEASERYCETRDPAAATQWARRARALRALASPPQVPAAAVRDLERFNARAGAARDAGEG